MNGHSHVSYRRPLVIPSDRVSASTVISRYWTAPNGSQCGPARFVLRHEPGFLSPLSGVGLAAVNFGPNSAGYDLWITGLELPTFGSARTWSSSSSAPASTH